MLKLTFVEPVHPEVILKSDKIRIGRDQSNDLVLALPTVSGFHAEIRKEQDRVVLLDLESTNGTFVNGERIRETSLAAGDRGSFDVVAFRLEAVETATVAEPACEKPDPLVSAFEGVNDTNDEDYLLIGNQKVPLAGTRVTIGRVPGNQVVLHNPTVSSCHAVLSTEAGSWGIEDNNSTNGTFVDGRRVERAPLYGGETLRFGDQEVLFFASEQKVPAVAPSVMITISDD